MGQVINGRWTTAPARVSGRVYALPEQDNDRVHLMQRVLVGVEGTRQEISQRP